MISLYLLYFGQFCGRNRSKAKDSKGNPSFASFLLKLTKKQENLPFSKFTFHANAETQIMLTLLSRKL